MGYYIQRDDDENFGKAEFLIEKHGARLLPTAPEWNDTDGIVCVVNNGSFEAAGYCYSPSELKAFKADSGPRQRPRKWLVMDKAKAAELSNFKR